jgi:hypothetical protein
MVFAAGKGGPAGGGVLLLAAQGPNCADAVVTVIRKIRKGKNFLLMRCRLGSLMFNLF